MVNVFSFAITGPARHMACFRGGRNYIFFICCIKTELLKHVEQTELLEYVELRLKVFKTSLTFILAPIAGFKS